jgi:hypothetical protein
LRHNGRKTLITRPLRLPLLVLVLVLPLLVLVLVLPLLVLVLVLVLVLPLLVLVLSELRPLRTYPQPALPTSLPHLRYERSYLKSRQQ